jgi:hypothetical protein
LTVQDPYARTRADWAAGTAAADQLGDADYRAGLAGERTAAVDAELLAAAGGRVNQDALREF